MAARRLRQAEAVRLTLTCRLGLDARDYFLQSGPIGRSGHVEYL